MRKNGQMVCWTERQPEDQDQPGLAAADMAGKVQSGLENVCKRISDSNSHQSYLGGLAAFLINLFLFDHSSREVGAVVWGRSEEFGILI